MKLSRSIFTSKVAQRIFILFICCSLLPIMVLAVVSFFQVSKALEEQSISRLERAVKAHGNSIFERLTYLETNLRLIASILPRQTQDFAFDDLPADLQHRLFNRFRSVEILYKAGYVKHVFGQEMKGLGAILADLETLDEEKITLTLKQEPDLPTRLIMVIGLQSRIPDARALVGEVDTTYLWGIGHENLLPPLTDLCVIDQYRKVLITSFPVNTSLLHKIKFSNRESTSRSFGYADEHSAYFVSYWSMFLQSRYTAPTIMVVLRSNKSDVFAPLSYFNRTFPLVVLLSLWIVLILSIIYIRKSLVPLEKLKMGTVRVARKDFDSQVDVTSGDEFEDLAGAFNNMAGQLGQHFNALKTRSDIDRAILSSLRSGQVIETALKQIYRFFHCEAVSVGVMRSKQPDSMRSFVYQGGVDGDPVEEYLKILPEDARRFVDNPEFTIIDSHDDPPGYLSSKVAVDMALIVVLPFFLDGKLAGIIAFSYGEEQTLTDDDMNHARQLANQVAVALSNAYLLEDIERLNWGTLEALARTVDAKSTWTAGHSERVAALSVQIAEAMGCSEKEIDSLHRAAFLHDIGKIGIPLKILDKPDSLSDEEYRAIKDHPSIGAKILAPIEAYADVIPMVKQHHERYNGKGYPSGLSGDDIVLGARIMAVADVYDAVASDRPYRKGWVEDKAIDLITKNAGKDFDPKVVEAFLSTR